MYRVIARGGVTHTPFMDLVGKNLHQSAKCGEGAYKRDIKGRKPEGERERGTRKKGKEREKKEGKTRREGKRERDIQGKMKEKKRPSVFVNFVNRDEEGGSERRNWNIYGL